MTSHVRTVEKTVSPRMLKWGAAVGAVGFTVAVVVASLIGSTSASAAIRGATTIYPTGTVPSTAAASDTAAVNVGVQFSVSQSGSIAGVRFYKSSNNKGAHTGALWSASGEKLATVTFKHESRSGWQTAVFSKPVAVSANSLYVASYRTSRGHYSIQPGAFANNDTIGNSTITARRGVFTYGSGLPQQSWNSSAYYVDVLFQPNHSGTAGSAPISESSSASSAGSSSAAAPSTPTSAATTATTQVSVPAGNGAASHSAVPPKTTAAAPPAATVPYTPGAKLTAPPAAGVPASARAALATYTGPNVITKAGTVISNVNVRGSLTINAANVVITNSVINGGSGSDGIYVNQGSATITGVTITGGSNGITGNNYTATRVEVTNLTDDGFKLGTNVHVDQAWCHDMNPGNGAHADCGQMQAGIKNMSVTNSWLVGGSNSALFLAPDLGPSSAGPVLISNNVLGWGNYTLYCVDGNNGEYFVSNITITNNQFLTNASYGPAEINVPITSSGNVWFTTGKPVGSKLG